ncbi:hypothetical protein GJAV_G00103720 [Gymnothorax javanicus]|nr:hypothetical protein GJAV_G00103720 [Gymnothorax javanicus]
MTVKLASVQLRQKRAVLLADRLIDRAHGGERHHLRGNGRIDTLKNLAVHILRRVALTSWPRGEGNHRSCVILMRPNSAPGNYPTRTKPTVF